MALRRILCVVVLVGLTLAAGGPAGAAPAPRSKASLIRLQADSDEAILLAQAMKDWLITDLQSQRAFQAVKYLVAQHWVRERGLEGLDARERAIYRDPARYDRPIVQTIWIGMGKATDVKPVEVVLTWDVSLELWDDLTRDVSSVIGDLGRTFAASGRRSIRIAVRFRDAEVLRVAAAPEGQTHTIFSYR